MSQVKCALAQLDPVLDLAPSPSPVCPASSAEHNS